MSLLSLLKSFFGSDSSWPVDIVADGKIITATADKENAYGQWHVTYDLPGVPYPKSKWITPTPDQRLAKLENDR